MKTKPGANRLLHSAILIFFLISNLSLTARNKPLPYSAASIILPAIPTAGTTLHADLLNTNKGTINPLKDKVLNHATRKRTMELELIERLEAGSSVNLLNIDNSQLNRPL